MTQLDLFVARPVRTQSKSGDVWHSPSGRTWVVTAVNGGQITMQYTHDGFTRTIAHSAEEWRRQGWRSEAKR